MPFATRCETPSGATSERLAAKPITEAVEDTCRTPRGRPMTWRSSVERRPRCRRARAPRPARWSPGSPNWRPPDQRPPVTPDRRDVLVVRPRRPRPVRRRAGPPSPRWSVRSPAPGGGQSVSARHSPADSSRSTTGGSAVLHVEHDGRLVHDPRRPRPCTSGRASAPPRAGSRCAGPGWRRRARRGSTGRPAPSSARSSAW